MTANLFGYQLLEQVSSTERTIVYRGIRQADQTNVIVKLTGTAYPTIEEINKLRHEYEISKILQFQGIVKPLGLEQYQNGLALIFPDFGGISLQKFLTTHSLDIQQFLVLGIKLADILAHLHKHQIIHKDINPKNIIIHPYTLEIQITDFSIAEHLPQSTSAGIQPQELEGTLPYISPEQTGRMNRSVDYRSDFYSLGITFYEILTGQVPFTTTDVLELIYAHLAQIPVSPTVLIPEIPEVISDIVMKLMAKRAEDRYQTAEGLKYDLEFCLKQFKSSSKIKPFPLSQRDQSTQLMIPQKLYGREAEIATLIDAFAQACTGSSELILVSGYSGIGKTSLIQEVHKPLTRQRGRFIFGKFDQFQRNIPYIALVQAFRELMHQLLTENDEQLSAWKNKLLNALEGNGQVIINIIPEVELIIGSQPSVPQLGATESQNRFNRVFQKFIHVFCSKLHPLVIFLDDLQWSDSASLNLIQSLLNHPESQYLLIIGAYRDNEIYPTHPLTQMMAEIQQSDVITHSIYLQPLTFNTVQQLLSDTLKKSDCLHKLAELIFNKTQGNPFFLTQLLKTLYKDKLLYFDLKTNHWLWDIHQIQSVDIIDYNIVELISRNIQELSNQTIKVLKLAACIGHQFNLDTLATINQDSPSNTAKQLWEALQAGLVIPLNNAYKIPLVESVECDAIEISYKFLHDRVQQAAYSLIPENQKKITHLTIGQLLLQSSDLLIQKNSIFDIVNQLNIGREFLQQQQERDQLVELNLIAAKKAKATTAYQASAEYLNIALELLSGSSWQSQYDLTFDLYREATEVAYLTTDFEQSEKLAKISLNNAKNLLDQVKIYKLKIQCEIAQQQIIRAIETGMQVLEILGVSLYQNNEVFDLPCLEDLEEMPEMTDPYHLITLQLLKLLSTAAYNGKPELFPNIILTEVNFCLQQGHSALAAPIYAMYSLLLCAKTEEIERGYQAGKIALKLLEQYQNSEFKCEVYDLFYGFTSPWKVHLKYSTQPLQVGIQSGLENGNLDFVGYCLMNYSYNQFFLGTSLNDLEKQQSDSIDLLARIKQEYPLNSIQILRELVLRLSHHSKTTTELRGSTFDQNQTLVILQQESNQTLLFFVYLLKTILLYLYQEYEQAVDMANVAAQYTTAVAGWNVTAIHNFYYSLSLLALCHQKNNQHQSREKRNIKKYIEQVNQNQELMKKWAIHAPMNYQHKFDLVEAEKARFTGKLLEAMEYYDRAIDGAKEQGYIQEAAIAAERATDFYLALKQTRTARTYAYEAYYAYIHWGANAKAEDLKTQYSQLFSEVMSYELRKTDTKDLKISVSTTTGKIDQLLDFSTMNKAALAFSEEIVLDKLMAKILEIAIENTGAVRGSLILEEENQFFVEATGYLEKGEIILKNYSSPVQINRDILPVSLINYVCRTVSTLVLDDAADEGLFTNDSYILKQKSKSILCMPILNQREFVGLIYLENDLATSVFNQKRLEILNFLSAQIGISLKKALLYFDLEQTTHSLKVAKQQLEEYNHNLEEKVKDRTLALQDKNRSLEEKTLQLEQTMQQLQATQAQLIQKEKMSSLGQMVAGIAHEINNPISFIFGNLAHVSDYFKDVFDALHLYQQELTHPPAEFQAEIEEIDLEFIEQDIPQMLQSMRSGATRIRDIVSNLRNFSCLDEAELKSVDIHQTIESVLKILQHQMNRSGHFAIKVIKQYTALPEVECYPRDLNQVLMNILANAVDALKEFKNQNIDSFDSATIQIKTELLEDNKISIAIADNGTGMTETVRDRIFDPFFTTKPIGSGTGLGLSVSYSTVVNQHKGDLRCVSTPGEGTEFIIEIPLKQA
jgi:predicted ATPase/signal transduction histidine kinase